MTLPWLPISLYPSATWLGLISLLPATAVFLAMLSLERRSRRVVIVLIFVIVLGSVVVDMLQIMGGEDSPLRFYEALAVEPLAIEPLDFSPTQTTMPHFYIPQFHSLQRG